MNATGSSSTWDRVPPHQSVLHSDLAQKMDPVTILFEQWQQGRFYHLPLYNVGLESVMGRGMNILVIDSCTSFGRDWNTMCHFVTHINPILSRFKSEPISDALQMSL